MFRTLFSKLLVTFISLALVMLLTCGAAAALIFRSHYLWETRNELKGELNAIHRIVEGEYLDSRQYAVAMEKLYAISRQYGASIHIIFQRNHPMNAHVVDAEYADRWQGDDSALYDKLTERALASENTFDYEYDLLEKATGLRTLTMTRLIMTQDGARLGVIVMSYDMSSVYSTLGKLYVDIFIFACIALLIAIPIAFIISQRITRPIAGINRAVTAFSRGSYDTRAEVEGRDEVAALAVSFNRMADEISEAETQRRNFVANVSHELRSPLTSMHGFLEAMSDGTIPIEEHDRYLPVLLDETERMTRLVNNLLDLSRIESGHGALTLTEFDINELITGTLLTFETRINEKDPEIDVRLDGRNMVLADPNRIAQVVNNLLDNAIRYLPDEGGRLTLSSETNSQFVTVSIGNNGEPIAPEDMPHIFERFYKAEKARTRTKTGGTGLGLAIAKLIINEHGGELTAVSDEKQTVFSFSVKRAPNRRS